MNCYILTEAGKKYGFGHVIRCKSFYNALIERGHSVEFIIHGDHSIENILANVPYRIFSWHGELQKLDKYFESENIIIIDSFYLSQSDIDFLCSKPIILVSIDDYLRNAYNNSIIIDWTIGIENTSIHKKNVSRGNKVLLGIDYCVLRKPFWKKVERKDFSFSNILFTLGGSDIHGLILPLLTYLSERFDELKFHVILGVKPDNVELFEELHNIQLHVSIDAEEVKSLMVSCDVAISGGGQILYELACTGLPTIAIKISENQQEDLDGWFSVGLIYKVHEWNSKYLKKEISDSLEEMRLPSVRSSMYSAIHELIKGDNVFKIIDLIEIEYNAKN